MNSKTLFLLCTLSIGTASTTFGMEKPVLPKRAHSMPILDSQKSKLMADESATKKLISQASSAIPSKKNRSCIETCCKALQIISEIFKTSRR